MRPPPSIKASIPLLINSPIACNSPGAWRKYVMKTKITASIVIYKNEPSVVLQAIQSFLQSETDCILFVIDNSPENDFQRHVTDSRIQYIFNGGKNLGFGTAH